MIFSKLDFFSSQFSFNTGNHQAKRGTLFGTVLSFIVFTTTIVYFVYIFTQYVTNQIDPIFRSQSIISQYQIETELNSDLIGFRFEYGSSSYEELYPKNYTYLVYLAYLQYTTPDISILIPLNVTDCTNPDLEGFKCLDFSNVKNYTLFLNTDKNMKSTVQVQTYGCRDIDTLKTTIPDNCADQSQIDSMINGINSILRFKIYTSQYNTATQQKEVNYRNAYVYTVANQQIVTQLKTQIQNTQIKQGLIVQSSNNFTSPIQCTQQDQSIDRNYALVQIGAGAYNMMILMVDEIVQHIQIQYPTLPQVLALVSSIFTLLMMLGIFGRIVSQKSIQQDLLILFLKCIYQDSYLGLLKKTNNNTLCKQQQTQQQIITNQENLVGGELRQSEAKETDDDKIQEKDQQVTIPAFYNRQKKSLDIEQLSNNNTYNIENMLFAHNNYQSSNNSQSPQSMYQSIYQDNIIDEINQENSNKNRHIINEIESDNKYSDTNQKQNQQKRNFSSYISQNNINRKYNFNNRMSQFQFKLQNKKCYRFNNKKANLMENLKVIQDINCSNKIQQDLRNIRKKMEDINKKQLQNIEQQIKKDMNIFNFIKDIILVKKAIMMILTKEQLAALHLVSCSSNYLDVDLNNVESDVDELEQRLNLSHYEKQLAILQSEKFQSQYLQDFLSKFSDDENINEIDIRILSSIKKCHLN
ncbi:AMP-binding enzyme family protein (macronuclear) [Tetrahymena thermophila SB210]|uniref:AMP-binding enzyme family protein n=1 Tax=Tetrahymena thermophila (strain SB210) TaxID=312017 RepID=Q241W8_TETTS|nr:AMP-binding enzyme family protein [Tetrahymena thermophila SB210]EAS02583.2 AMP-binding enzyme family protein [Tetrahymena thermophila SB210]|eukprot:XP_001022828.2 AMP-binding enzyme family protein [Tetrahymena thermophila SB210]